MLRRASEAQVPDHPEQVYYVAAILWPDGTRKQGHFVFDEDRYAGMQKEQGENCPEREFIVLQMMSQLIEEIFTARRAEKRAKQIFRPG
jgi:hypothetical protein